VTGFGLVAFLGVVIVLGVVTVLRLVTYLGIVTVLYAPFHPSLPFLTLGRVPKTVTAQTISIGFMDCRL
jgi:hypothetical protein